MKVGILTHPLETNYGGILQAFALQTALRKMGFDAITIDRHNRVLSEPFAHHAKWYLKRLFRHYFRSEIISDRWNPSMTEKDYEVISSNTRRFVESRMSLTTKVYSDELWKIDRDYAFDAYVVGSDQVWNRYYCPASFLDFVKRDNVRRVFYAASSSPDIFAGDPSLCQKCRELIAGFDAVSVREKPLVRLAEDSLGVKAELVLDPVLLLEPEDFMSKIKSSPEHGAHVFSYILDKTVRKSCIVERVSSLLSLPVESVNAAKPYVRMWKMHLEDNVFPSVDNWLESLATSSFVVTDSFHGAVFSILFNKPFVVIGNEMRGIERFKTLLSTFSLESRLLHSPDELDGIAGAMIDYENVNNLRKSLKARSIEFLENALTNKATL
ncbi:MAG: polysaccharide pyruvyl transferase family protein [Bacteroidales bacterium]